MKSRTILSAITCLLFIWGCDEKEIPTFSTDDSGIYFQKVNSWVYGSNIETYGDSLSISFASANSKIKGGKYSATVKTMGKVRDYDRPFKVEVDTEESTAIEGVHFDINVDTLVVKAGESSAKVSVYFHRTEDLTKNTVRLKLNLVDNEHFTCYFDKYKNTNDYKAKGDTIHGSSFVFSVSEKYTEPNYWNWFGGDFFGPWTPQKFVIVNEVCGFTSYDWNYAGFAGMKITYGRFDFFARSVQDYLQAQADAGTPVLDEGGKYMQLADNYLVDYSKYE